MGLEHARCWLAADCVCSWAHCMGGVAWQAAVELDQLHTSQSFSAAGTQHSLPCIKPLTLYQTSRSLAPTNCHSFNRLTGTIPLFCEDGAWGLTDLTVSGNMLTGTVGLACCTELISLSVDVSGAAAACCYVLLVLLLLLGAAAVACCLQHAAHTAPCRTPMWLATCPPHHHECAE